MVRHSLKVGLSFGLTSGVVTTLGLVVGLYIGTYSKLTVLGAILTIAMADSFSDALGIHISEESEAKHTARETWESALATFLTKFGFAATFAIPVLLLPMATALAVSVIWGLVLLGGLSFLMAKVQKANPWKAVLEHFIVALVVVAWANLIGGWLRSAIG